MIEIGEQGQPLAEEQIVALEAELGVKLSESYRRFLKENNGGRPSPDVVDVVGLSGSPTDIQIFFGIGRKFKSSDLLWNYSLIKERCSSRHVLPIACDSGGNPFCLEISDGVTTEVLYCDLDGSVCDYYDVAPDFSSFVDMIRVW